MQKNKFWEKTKEILKSGIGKKSLLVLCGFVAMHVLVAIFAVVGVVNLVKRDAMNETVTLPEIKEPAEIFAQSVGSVVSKENLSDINDLVKEETTEEKLKEEDEELLVPAKEAMAEIKAEEEKEEAFSLDAGENVEILNGFCADKLQKNEITGDWRAHTGIDIKRKEKSEIYAFESGKVTKIYDDALYGKTVEVTHKDGYLCVYKNLDDNIAVNENEEIKKGDLIGRVGESSIMEKQMDSHLHFEVIKDSKAINPEDYMAIK